MVEEKSELTGEQERFLSARRTQPADAPLHKLLEEADVPLSIHVTWGGPHADAHKPEHDAFWQAMKAIDEKQSSASGTMEPQWTARIAQVEPIQPANSTPDGQSSLSAVPAGGRIQRFNEALGNNGGDFRKAAQITGISLEDVMELVTAGGGSRDLLVKTAIDAGNTNPTAMITEISREVGNRESSYVVRR